MTRRRIARFASVSLLAFSVETPIVSFACFLSEFAVIAIDARFAVVGAPFWRRLAIALCRAFAVD